MDSVLTEVEKPRNTQSIRKRAQKDTGKPSPTLRAIWSCLRELRSKPQKDLIVSKKWNGSRERTSGTCKKYVNTKYKIYKSGIPSQIIKDAKQPEDMTHNLEEKQPIETDPEVTQMIE